MKVLWLSGNPGRYNEDKGNKIRLDGSWIASLETEIQKRCSDIELGLVFLGGSGKRKEYLNGITYYPIPEHHLLHKFSINGVDKYYLREISFVLQDFKPDIIQVFGSEIMTGLVYLITDLPVVLHIQGILTPIYDAYYPPRYNFQQEILVNPIKFVRSLKEQHCLKYAIKRECDILSHIKYFMGRTGWDKCVMTTLAPNSRYFYCSEILRSTFFESNESWNFHFRINIKIISIINSATYKGSDVILRTAKLLKKLNQDFEWCVCGVDNLKFGENLTHIKSEDVNVKSLGKKSATELKHLLLESDCYAHLSYIENSPNSVCEAQILGVPVIAANVGGVSSLIIDGINGFLVPANDSYMTASKIIHISKDQELATKISKNGRVTAQTRHNPITIVNDLMKAYNDILKYNN